MITKIISEFCEEESNYHRFLSELGFGVSLTEQ